MYMDLETLRIQPFTISVKYADMLCTLRVEQMYVSTSKEIFTVSDGSVSFYISSDRPSIKAHTINKKKSTYNAIDAQLERLSLFQRIVSEIESHIKMLDTAAFN